MRNISIVEFPFNLGLKEVFPGQEPGVRRLPEWLKQYHFHEIIGPGDIHRLEAPDYHMVQDPVQFVLNTDDIVAYAGKQAALLNTLFSEKKFPLVIGGDCSIFIGIALALKKAGNYAVFYLDGHTDFMEPELSETKAAGGMVAAIVAGRGHPKLTNIDNELPYIKEQHVWCVGNREYDDEYEDAIRFSDATYISLDMLREKGLAQVVASFLEMVKQESLDGFWLHIDVDVLADDIMPAVDSRTPGGLTYQEFN
ncbi:MAG: arginase family protein [Bacteroidota bacterium]